MIISPDKKGTLDAPTYNLLKEVKTDIPLVQINVFTDYEFNAELYNLDKWVLVDFSELGANQWDLRETLIWGKNSELFNYSKGEEWQKFDQFVKEKPPIGIFKRELLKKDKTENILPINFPCYWQIPPPNSKTDFENRKLDVFNVWGYSHELRRMFHGECFVNAVKNNKCIIDSFSNLEHELSDNRKKWLSVFTPHYARQDMNYVLGIQAMSKLSVSLPGAGVHCFRHSESPINSVMVMRDDPIAYSFEWKHNFNCIKFSVGTDIESIRGLNGAKEIFEAIEEALQNPNLYDIYLEGIKNCEKYRIDKYCTEYIEPIIKQWQ